jgi:hypothetical protein
MEGKMAREGSGLDTNSKFPSWSDFTGARDSERLSTVPEADGKQSI